HWFTGMVVGVSGLASGILVVAANAWMNSPAGFDFVNGKYLNIDPIEAMFNKAWFSQALHMCLAAFTATGFAVAGVHALMILRNQNKVFHLKAFKIAAVFACIGALLQPLSGDISAKDVAKRQPAKLAAMEALYQTEKPAPLLIGGIVNEKDKTVKGAIKVPGALSFLAHGDFKAEVKGLDQIPENEQPPVAITHYAFQIMVGIGTLLALISLVYFINLIRKKSLLEKRWLLKLFVLAIPLGYVALEAGWVVTEVGRQPWIIYGIMRTKDAVTPMPGIAFSFYIFSAIYLSLSIIVTFLLYRQIKMVPVLYSNVNPKTSDH
ncbi:cytochrome ubiquinol oxidase subunit I, partial [Pedobacter agri]